MLRIFCFMLSNLVDQPAHDTVCVRHMHIPGVRRSCWHELLRHCFGIQLLQSAFMQANAPAAAAAVQGLLGSVNDVSFSSDGRRLLGAGGDKRLLVWNTASGQVSTYMFRAWPHVCSSRRCVCHLEGTSGCRCGTRPRGRCGQPVWSLIMLARMFQVYSDSLMMFARLSLLRQYTVTLYASFGKIRLFRDV
jgi:hypothetical protein